jgi:GAF domain-containing protein
LFRPSLIVRTQSPAQPVFDAIAAAALRLCEAAAAHVVKFDGREMHSAALASDDPIVRQTARRLFPRPPDRATAAGRAILACNVVAISDVLEDPEFLFRRGARHGYRSVLGVPLLSNGKPIGAIAIGRDAPGPFPQRQIALVQTFADQAVIAIENERLLNELQARNRALTEALEQQTATAEILRIISRSPTDVSPVFDTIATAALKLCRGEAATVISYDGNLLHMMSLAARLPGAETAIRALYPRPADDGTAVGRAVLSRGVIAIDDVLRDAAYAFKEGAGFGYRSVLGVPLMRDGRPIGALSVGRTTPGPYSDQQIALLQTFADQAMIAIDNTRLFQELQARNRALTEALDHQTATSEILRIISSSPTDTQPVFESIAAAALRLCDAGSANVFTYDGSLVHIRALAVAIPEAADAVRPLFPRPADRGSAASRAVLTRSVVAIPDVLLDPDYAFHAGAHLGFRSVLGIPLLRDGEPIGAIAVGRPVPGPFPESQVALLQTFADQAVIAIENARLFDESQRKTAQLTQTVEQLQALAAVGQAVSSTLELETVLRTIVARAIDLVDVDGGAIFEYDETREEFCLHAADRLPDELVDALRAAPFPKGEGAIGRMADTGEPAAFSDIRDESAYRSRVRDILVRLGYRSLLAVPLLRENRLLGGLIVNRKVAGDFAPQMIELLQAFATQSALAIHNARLFREIEDKSRQLEIASRHKSAFLANMSHELRTPLNAIIGFTRIALRRLQGQIEAKQYENLEKILASAQHLLALINAILDIAKVEAGRVEVHAGTIALGAVLEQCVRTVEPLVRDGVRLEADIEAGVTLATDAEKLRQIVINLLSNAAKFTPAGSIRLRACAHVDTVTIAIADTGIGIPADKLESIFEEFEQVDGGSTREYGGTGLGLAIARRLARLLGGDIRVRSALGAGSTFTLALPIRYRPPAP